MGPMDTPVSFGDLVRLGLLPDPETGLLMHRDSEGNLQAQVMIEAYHRHKNSGGNSSVVKQAVPTTPESILAMVTTEHSSLTLKHGVEWGELDTLINILTKLRDSLPNDSGYPEGGVHGHSVVGN